MCVCVGGGGWVGGRWVGGDIHASVTLPQNSVAKSSLQK